MPSGGKLLLLANYKDVNGSYGPGHVIEVADANEQQSLLMSGRAATTTSFAQNVGVTALGTTTATVSFTYDRPISDTYVAYGLAGPPLGTLSTVPCVPPTGGPGVFTANLTGLTPATNYYYFVTSYSSGGPAPHAGPNNYFRTL